MCTPLIGATDGKYILCNLPTSLSLISEHIVPIICKFSIYFRGEGGKCAPPLIGSTDGKYIF